MSSKKCDGNQPKCNQCIRFNRSNECEFIDGPAPSTTRVLEQHIARLESRIQELEQDDPTLVRLHNPYNAGAATGSSSGSSRSSAIQSNTQHNWWETPDPPVRVAQVLVRNFLSHAGKFGFFLDPARFLNSLSAPSAARPLPPSVLRNAVYLWGIHLSQDPQYTVREPIFLGRTLRSVHIALSTAQEQQQNTLHVLQAEILLANYFFHNNRLLEAKFHSSASVSLAFMCNLHQIMSRQPATGTYNFLSPGPAWIPPATDAVDEAERIQAWWTTFILDKSWVVALGAPAMINESQEPVTMVDTPWPLTMELYSQAVNMKQPASARPNPGSTTQRFFANVVSDREASYMGLHAKAAALYERANYLATYLDRSSTGYEATVVGFDGSIERFKQILPPIERPNPLSADTAHYLLVIHCLCQSATIQLHRGFAARSSTSMTKCLTAANSIIRTVQAVGVQSIQFVNPIIGVLLSMASEVLIQGLRSLRSSQSAWASSSALPGEDRFVIALNHLSGLMGGLSASPFIGLFLVNS
ncbi:hypothetical protein PHLCEN_2v13086 [Hermanssonia centrifuga]|uniref:Xylanolytic transcriptional activator regulatory domain-containing protein n=1 Tax=Hermanssonia centrifuga TaxID=98765 RepID=A0A2R6NFJ9_9APHY|nr:hypothetical protein PHLCEN_2v13086 [Hermanssonia centrifuga]